MSARLYSAITVFCTLSMTFIHSLLIFFHAEAPLSVPMSLYIAARRGGSDLEIRASSEYANAYVD
jgi:hypothetical protein